MFTCLLREYIKREVESLYRLLYNQRSHPLVVRKENATLTYEAYTSIQPEESPLVVRKENAALTHEAYTSIQPDESPPGGQ